MASASNKGTGSISNFEFNSWRLSQTEIDDMREAFDLFDVEQKGFISATELAHTLRELQQERTNKAHGRRSSSGSNPNVDLLRLINALSSREANDDENGDNNIDFEDFVGLLVDETAHNACSGGALGANNDTDVEVDEAEQAEAEMIRIFNLFDASGKGYVDADDLRKVANDLGETEMSDDELREMICRGSGLRTNSSSSPAAAGASNRQDKVTYEDFCAIMTKKLFP